MSQVGKPNEDTQEIHVAFPPAMTPIFTLTFSYSELMNRLGLGMAACLYA